MKLKIFYFRKLKSLPDPYYQEMKKLRLSINKCCLLSDRKCGRMARWALWREGLPLDWS